MLGIMQAVCVAAAILHTVGVAATNNGKILGVLSVAFMLIAVGLEVIKRCL